jgi:tRNA(His) 5'-end guanylyltransferase
MYKYMRFKFFTAMNWARDSVDSRGTMLQVGRARDRFLMRSLESLINPSFSTTLWPLSKIFLGEGELRLMLKTNNLTFICEPIV